MSLLNSDTNLNQRSYYEASVTRPALQPALQGEITADVAIVGAGFAGLSAALELAKRGMKVVVLEAGRIGSGASGRNGGQAIVGYASGQAPFEAQLGMADAKRAWDMSLEAIALIDERITQHSIECDRVHGYLYVADSPRKAAQLKADMDEQRDRYGLQSEWAEGAQVQRFIASPRYVAAAYESTSGHLHPLKFCLGLSDACIKQGVRIFEKSAVISLEANKNASAKAILRTASGSVKAEFVLLAGNCYLPEYGPQVAPELSKRIMPVGTYIAGTEVLGEARCRELIASNAAVCDNNFVLDYFRFSADHRMLFGGRVSYSARTPGDLANTMQQRMALVFPQLKGAKQEFLWGGFVDISMNRAPDFGRVAPNVYYLQGFSGHGVALTQLAGKLVAEAISGQAERFDMFARLKHRSFPGGKLLRTPSLVIGMAYHQLKDLL
jgi:gamma-glutamylputrescine oxidase